MLTERLGIWLHQDPLRSKVRINDSLAGGAKRIRSLLRGIENVRSWRKPLCFAFALTAQDKLDAGVRVG